MRQHKPIQMGIFDIPRPAQPAPAPQKAHDPAIIGFIEDIELKKSVMELDQWRYKHRNRINALPIGNRFEVLNYLKRKKEMLK